MKFGLGGGRILLSNAFGQLKKRREVLKAEANRKKKRALFGSKQECEERIERYFTLYLAESGEVADIESLADYLGSTREEIMGLMNDKRFGRALRKARNRIAKIKKQLAFGGKIPAAVLSFDLKNNHGYRDKPEDSEGNSEQVIFRGRTADWAK